ncbi:hypothetical protein J3S90_09255 [Flavobacterium sp. P4023]|uniref:HEPN domain-containing protein n=1 Tax=Flavobacterium flabelliforme TaxID=2816119 RepID=A0ABS5CTP5_9FLAO|nr:hypothetical protein [Flavobacterium flabelliforme]MBP4141989.1 hypothetical protein [Flavobacterium flabelliforme]
MTSSEVQKKIESISYYHNRHIHSGALNICNAILRSKNFSLEIKQEVQIIKLKLEGLSEPWGYWESRASADYNMLKDVQECLDSIYELME